ncbi:MAG: hypothetical protein EA389_05515 [Ilumatobacter sp.]|nr:MAG: hypothetical protein EA389_05515 [Ilumatobacter sp.]
MTDHRPEDFDDLAARSRDRALRDAEAIADADSALARVRSGVGASSASSWGRRGVVLAAAALVAVVSVSAVVWLARDTDEQIATSPVTAPAVPPPVQTTEPPATVAPTTVPTTTVPPTTTEPEESAEVTDQCLSEPVAPPALIDGSAPGEGVLGEFGENRSVVWGGESFHAVTQILDAENDPDEFAAANRLVIGDHEAWFVPVSTPPMGGIWLYWRDPTDCVRVYEIASGHMLDEARDYMTRWLTSIDTGEDFVRAFDPEFDAPTEYVALRFVGALFDDVRRLAPDGTDLGTHPDVASFPDNRLPQGARLADGRRLEPARNDSGSVRCSNEPVTIDGEPLHPELGAARAINSTPEGIVIAARDVCPGGASWGDPGTRWELVRVDLRQPDPQVEVLLTRDPSPGVADGEPHATRVDGTAGISAISPEGGLVALSQYTGGERDESTIRSADNPDEVIDLPSRCAAPGPIVAAPVFLADQRVVLARTCPDSTSEPMFVETVDIDTGAVDHSVEVGDLAELSEFRYITLSAVIDDGEIWSIVSIADSDRATTALLVRGDVATEITQPGFRTYAFTIDDLAFR